MSLHPHNIPILVVSFRVKITYKVLPASSKLAFRAI